MAKQRTFQMPTDVEFFIHEGVHWAFEKNADLGHEQGAYYACDRDRGKVVVIFPEDKERAIDCGGNAKLMVRDYAGEDWQELRPNCHLEQALDVGSAVVKSYRSISPKAARKMGGRLPEKELEQMWRRAVYREIRAAARKHKREQRELWNGWFQELVAGLDAKRILTWSRSAEKKKSGSRGW